MYSQKTFQQPYMIEKIVAALSYVSAGLIGFIWLLLGIFTKSNVRVFLKYHIFQSIFLAIAYFLFCAILGLLMNVLSVIPYVNNLIIMVTFFLNMPLVLGYSIIQILIYTVIFYLVVTSLQGKYSYLPWISEIIKANVRNN